MNYYLDKIFLHVNLCSKVECFLFVKMRKVFLQQVLWRQLPFCLLEWWNPFLWSMQVITSKSNDVRAVFSSNCLRNVESWYSSNNMRDVLLFAEFSRYLVNPNLKLKVIYKNCNQVTPRINFCRRQPYNSFMNTEAETIQKVLAKLKTQVVKVE